MPWGAAIVAAGAIGGSLISSNASKSAANTQANAANAAAQLQAQQKQPWVDAGKTGLATLTAGLQPGGQFMKNFSMSDATNSPAEKFALEQGTQAINNSNAARSGTLNTNATQDLVKFAEGNAAQYENQAFNQFMSQQGMQLGAVESLAQTGQTAVTSSADTTASLMTQAANASAAGQIGSANAIGGGISNIANSLQQQQMLSKLLGTNTNTTGVGGINSPAPMGGYSGDPYASAGELDASFSLSDERLKEDQELVGHTKDGLPIYTYRMRGSQRKQMGVMAQDVERYNPSAVRHHASGFKMVDYSKVH